MLTGNAAWDAYIQTVLDLTNEHRAIHGLDPLTLNADLFEAAHDHSIDMAVNDFFDHDNLEGQKPWDRVDETGYDWNSVGENIAAGYSSPQSVVQAWINSPGHNANLLNDSFTEIGISYYNFPQDDGELVYYHYWTQVFGNSPDGPTPLGSETPPQDEPDPAEDVPLAQDMPDTDDDGDSDDGDSGTPPPADDIGSPSPVEVAQNEVTHQGTSGKDKLKGDDGDDVMDGGNGKDKLSGKDGDDILMGGGGADKIKGDDGSDTLMGDAGEDKVDGKDGNDILAGGTQDDVLKGGAGADIFVFDELGGNDLVKDFDLGEGDRIDLTGLDEINSFADILARFVQDKKHAVFTADDGIGFTLRKTDIGDFDADDFFF